MFTEHIYDILKKQFGNIIPDNKILETALEIKNEYQKNIFALNIVTNLNERVNYKDILYISKPKNKILIYTEHAIFEFIYKGKINIFDLIENNSNFVLANGKTIINKTKVIKYDSYMKRLYFEFNIRKDSFFVEVSHKIINDFVRELGKEHDLDDRIGEYSSLDSRKQAYT